MPSFGDRRGSVQIILHTACQGSREGRGGRKILTRPTRQCQAQQSQGRGQGGETRLYKTAHKNEGWTDIDMYRIIFFSTLIIFVWKKQKQIQLGDLFLNRLGINTGMSFVTLLINSSRYTFHGYLSIEKIPVKGRKKKRLEHENKLKRKGNRSRSAFIDKGLTWRSKHTK